MSKQSGGTRTAPGSAIISDIAIGLAKDDMTTAQVVAWDGLSDSQKTEVIEKTGFTGMIDYDSSSDLLPNLHKDVTKKAVFDAINETLENAKMGNDTADENYIIGYSDGSVRYMYGGAFDDGIQKANASKAVWAVTNGGVPSYGHVYWAKDSRSLASMQSYTEFKRIEKGKIK